MTSIAFRDGARDVPPSAEGLLDSLDRPTVFRVAGRDHARTRVVAALMHGNEPSGLVAIHAALRAKERPAVDSLFFVGAVEAARVAPRFSQRMLPGRRDLNRCFRPPFEGLDGAIAREALEAFSRAAPEAVIDIHNNSGRNPPYGVGVLVDPGRLGLTTLFAERYVHSTIALGALMEAFSGETAIVTVECGRAGDPGANRRAIAGLTRFLALETLPRVTPSSGALDIFVDPVRVEVARDVSLAFGEAPARGADVTFDEAVDRHNFQELEPGSEIGWTTLPELPLVAYRGDGTNVARELFEVQAGVLRTRRPMVPIMMTTSAVAARQDCLFYACARMGPGRARGAISLPRGDPAAITSSLK